MDPVVVSFDLEEPLSSLQVDLVPAGDGNEFHTQNASPQDWERHSVIQRTEDAVQTYCDLMDVKHGTLDRKSGDLATLMVFRFRFNPQKSGRRIYRARIHIEFFSANNRSSAPDVEAIAPEERWSLLPTTDHEETIRGGELSLGVAGVPLVDAGGSVKLEKTVARDVSSSTTVTGAMNLGTGMNSGAYTCAVWTLVENEKRKTGVPDSLRVAVLLRREDDELFNAKVTLEAYADVATSFGRFFRKVPLDDPVHFNPKFQPKHPRKGRSYGVENLGAIDLYSLCDAKMSAKAFWASE